MRKNWSRVLVSHLHADGFHEQPAIGYVCPEIGLKNAELESQLCNWGLVVNPINTGSGAASSFWAAKYYEIKNSNLRRELILRGLIEVKSTMQKIEEQAAAEQRYQDAMDIEKAWASLTDCACKQALLMRYVQRHKNEFIRRRLGLRGHKNLELILWRAKTSIKQILEREKNVVIIRSDNLNSIAG